MQVSAALVLAAATFITALQSQGMTDIKMQLAGSVNGARESFQVEARDSKGKRRQMQVHFEAVDGKHLCVVTLGSGKERSIGTGDHNTLAVKAAKLLK